MRLEWSHFALSDRDAIFDYIEADNPAAAVAVDDRLSHQIGTLPQFPESGRAGRVPATIELAPYIAVYHIDGNVVRVLRLLHGAQLWPDEMPT